MVIDLGSSGVFKQDNVDESATSDVTFMMYTNRAVEYFSKVRSI